MGVLWRIIYIYRCDIFTWPWMSPQTVTGVLTGCTFDSSISRSQTISHSRLRSFSGRYLQFRAISTQLSRSVDIILCCWICWCVTNENDECFLFSTEQCGAVGDGAVWTLKVELPKTKKMVSELRRSGLYFGVFIWGGKQERFADAELARPEPRFDLLEREKRTEEDRVPERRKPSLLSFKLEKKVRNVNITLTLFVVVGKRQHYLPSGRCVKAPLSVKQYDSSLLLSYLSSFHMDNSP